MTIQETRATLLSAVMRRGDIARIAKVFERLDGHEASEVLVRSTPLELRRAASILLTPQWVKRCADALDSRAMIALISHANVTCVAGGFAALDAKQAAPLLASVAPPKRQEILGAMEAPVRARMRSALPRSLRGDNSEDLSTVLRLKRLFA